MLYFIFVLFIGIVSFAPGLLHLYDFPRAGDVISNDQVTSEQLHYIND